MTSRSTEKTVENAAAHVEKLHAIASQNVDVLTRSNTEITSALASLTTALQESYNRNTKMFSACMTGLLSAQGPTDFFALQQNLIHDGVEAGATDAHIFAELGASVFIAAFEPMRKQVAVLPEIVKTATKLPWARPALVEAAH